MTHTRLQKLCLFLVFVRGRRWRSGLGRFFTTRTANRASEERRLLLLRRYGWWGWWRRRCCCALGCRNRLWLWLRWLLAGILAETAVAEFPIRAVRLLVAVATAEAAIGPVGPVIAAVTKLSAVVTVAVLTT